MASNALVRLTNTSVRSLAFSVDISKPVKFVSRLVLPASGSAEVEAEVIMPMVLFDRSFQNAVASGQITIQFAFTTSAGVASTASNYLGNVSRFLNANAAGWLAS